MDHAFRVRAVECAADLLHHRNRILWRELPRPAQKGAQIFAVDILHADEADALGLPQIENTDHILMRDVAGENQLLFEARENSRIGRQFGTYDLERDQAVQFAVAGLVDRAHPTLSEYADDFVASTEKHSRLQALKGGNVPGWKVRRRSRTLVASHVRKR